MEPAFNKLLASYSLSLKLTSALCDDSDSELKFKAKKNTTGYIDIDRTTIMKPANFKYLDINFGDHLACWLFVSFK